MNLTNKTHSFDLCVLCFPRHKGNKEFLTCALKKDVEFQGHLKMDERKVPFLNDLSLNYSNVPF